MHAMTEDLAGRFAAIALGHVRREYPHKLDQVLSGPADLAAPSILHPIFYGSFDWHSCVHGYWMLARLLRRFPAMPVAGAIRALFDAQLTPAKVAIERAYLDRPGARGFERPYGWAWLLMLAAELTRHEAAWAAAIAPLGAAFAERLRAFLPRATYPVRTGTHGNTAFALLLAQDHAEASDPGLAALLRDTAWRWYRGDRGCQAWEPGGDDFLSPALIEALCIHRLRPDAFAPWFDAFLPELGARLPATLFTPATVSDRSDGKIAHLDGLNLSRAWCLRRLAAALQAGDARRAVLEEAAAAHLQASLPHVAGDYMGEHWLATYAVLALDQAAS